MGRIASFDHDLARSRLAAGISTKRLAKQFGVTPGWISRLTKPKPVRPYQPVGEVVYGQYRRSNPRLLAALGVNGTDPERAASVTALSARLRTLRAQVRAVGPLCVDSPTVAAAHAAGLTLDDIHEVFAVPPAEAVRAIAAHAER